ncbi:MAG: YdcF family protein [Rhodospirillaceae bacterium]|nr:YdcF family protein [Rhodospirillaceae bacterium]
MDTFFFLKLLLQLSMPPTSLVVGLIVGAVLVALGWRILGRLVATLGVAQLVLMSLHPISDPLVVSLENRARVMAAEAPGCCYDYIVVLGGAVGAPLPPGRPDPHLTEAADRVWHAARLFKQGVAPKVLLSGGNGPTIGGDLVMAEADAMRILLLDFGVPADRIVLENKSMNTIENMRGIRDIVGTAPIALITSAIHMPRAMQLARLANLNVQAFPTDWRIVPDLRPPVFGLMPAIGALNDSLTAVKEHIALMLDSRGNALKP